MGIKDFFGLGETAKGIGEGVSTATQGVRHLITGDVSPDMVVKLQEVEIELVKVHAQIVDSDNKAGGLNKLIRPVTFLMTFLSWLILVWVEAITNIMVDPSAMDRLDVLLWGLFPSFFIYRTYEKVKGITS